MMRIQISGFDEMTLNLAIEKSLKQYKNMNVEVDQHTANNRMVFLLEDVFHASKIVHELENFSV